MWYFKIKFQLMKMFLTLTNVSAYLETDFPPFSPHMTLWYGIVQHLWLYDTYFFDTQEGRQCIYLQTTICIKDFLTALQDSRRCIIVTVCFIKVSLKVAVSLVNRSVLFCLICHKFVLCGRIKAWSLHLHGQLKTNAAIIASLSHQFRSLFVGLPD